MNPKISIIMGIYNCAKTLPDAIDSILNQTITDWQLIMCDDGSVDNTYEVAYSYQKLYPDKIIVVKNKINRGLNYTLNKCLKLASGEYIARMDGDDVCVPDRFAKELTTLLENPEIAIVSSDMDFFDENGTWGLIQHPTFPQKTDFIRESPFCHAPCMIRREAMISVGGYTDKKCFLRVEDYHLWMKLYDAGYKGQNLHEVLYSMRDDRAAYSRRKFRYRINEAYVKLLIALKFRLPVTQYIHILRPIIVGLLPGVIYDKLHKMRLDKKS